MITWLALLPHPLCPSEKKALRDKRVINFYSSLKKTKATSMFSTGVAFVLFMAADLLQTTIAIGD
jgi:hypothetical protein